MRLTPKLRWAAVLLPSFAVFAESGLTWSALQKEITAKPGEATLSVDFPFTNKGAKPVEISDVDTGCECTLARPSLNSVAPGASGVIHVDVDLSRASGTHDETIDIYTNGAKTDPDELHLKVTVPETYRLAPTLLLWKSGEAAQAKSLRLEATAGHTVRVVDAKAATDSFEATFKALAGGTAYEVQVRPRATAVGMTVPIEIEVSVDGAKPVLVQAYALIASG